MKSAYELAMERLGGAPLREYSAAQKEQLAELDRKVDARVVQARLQAETALRAVASDPAKQAETQANMAAEIASLEDRRKRDKDELRKQFDAE